MRSLLTLSLFFVLFACGPFLPEQRAEIIDQLSSAQNSLAEARATLAIDPSAPYSKLEPHMISALASSQQALNVAESRANALQGRSTGESALAIAKVVAACRDAIKTNALEIRANGVPPNQDSNLETIMSGTCAVSKFAEGLARE
jgi:hypothetical protein